MPRGGDALWRLVPTGWRLRRTPRDPKLSNLAGPFATTERKVCKNKSTTRVFSGVAQGYRSPAACPVETRMLPACVRLVPGTRLVPIPAWTPTHRLPATLDNRLIASSSGGRQEYPAAGRWHKPERENRSGGSRPMSCLVLTRI